MTGAITKHVMGVGTTLWTECMGRIESKDLGGVVDHSLVATCLLKNHCVWIVKFTQTTA